MDDLRRLGSARLAITPVGLGTWAIGGEVGEGYGPLNDTESVAAIHRAVAGGIGWIDTAPVYGLGHSEEIVGRALATMPRGERPLLFTKCGLVADPKRPSASPSRNLTPESMRRELEASLRRLGVERIDLYQIHRPDETGTPVEDSWGEMGRFIDEGKVRYAGVSNFTLAELQAYEAIRHINSLQPRFSLIHREAADQIAWCAQHGVGVLAYGPMGAGLLTSDFSVDRALTLATGDWRRGDPEFAGQKLRRNLAVRDSLHDIASPRGVSVAAIAIAWVNAWPGVTAAIAGARRPAQVDNWLSAMNIDLTSPEFDQICRALEVTGAGNGPSRPSSP